MTASTEERDHLVVTVHGIRTFGQWQERLEALLTSEASGAEAGRIEVVNYKYGYFSAIAFMIPLLRWLVVRRFRNTLERQISRRSWRRVDIVAHSFGTHLMGWALFGLRKRPLRIHTVIVAGSVLRSEFPWHELVGTSVRRVINECGTADSILLLSQFFVLFTGMAGRVGFSGMTGESFRNRFHPFGHSGYFLDSGRPSDTFMMTEWVPLLTTDAAVAWREDPRSAGALAGVKTWLTNNMEPVKLTAYVLPLFAVIVWVLLLYLGGEANRRVAVAARIASEVSERPGPDATPAMTHQRLRSALAAAQTVRQLDAPSAAAYDALATAANDIPRRVVSLRTKSPVVAFDPTSRFIAVADGTSLRLVDVLSGDTGRVFTLPEPIRAIAIHPGGAEIAVGGNAGSIIRIDPDTNRGVESSHRFSGPVEAIAFDKTGRFLGAVARESAAATIRVLGENDRLLAEDSFRLQGDDSAPALPQLTFDGGVTAAVTVPYPWERQGVHLLGLGSDFRVHHDDDAKAAFFDETGALLTVEGDGEIHRRSRAAAKESVALPPLDLSFSVDRLLVTARGDRIVVIGGSTEDVYLPLLRYTFVHVYSVPGGKLLAQLPRASVDAVAISEDSNRIAIADGREVRVHSASNGQFEAVVELDKPVIGIALSGDGGSLFTAAADGTSSVWNISDVREQLRLPVEHVSMTPLLSDDQQFVATFHQDQPVSIWSLANGKRSLSYRPTRAVTEAAFGARELALMSPSSPFAFPPESSEIEVYGAASGAKTLAFATGERLTAIAFDRSGTLLAAGTAAGNVLLWRKKNGKWPARPTTHKLATGIVSTLAFSPDSRFFASGSGVVIGVGEPAHDDKLRVCEVDRFDGGDRRCHMQATIPGGVNDVAFSSDGRSVAAASGASRVFLFDHLSNVPLRTVELDLEYVQRVRFADQDRSLITLSTMVASRGLARYTVGSSVDVSRIADGARTDHRGLERRPESGIWNVKSPVLHAPFIGSDGSVSAVVFRNLIEYMATRSSLTFPDVVVWHVENGKLVETFRDGSYPTVMAVASGPTRVATVDSATRTVHISDTDPRRLFEVACATVRSADCSAEQTAMDGLHRAALHGGRDAAAALWRTVVPGAGKALLRSRVALGIAGAMVLILIVAVARSLTAVSPALRVAVASVLVIVAIAGARLFLGTTDPRPAEGSVRANVPRAGEPKPVRLEITRVTTTEVDREAVRAIERRTRQIIADQLGISPDELTPVTSLADLTDVLDQANIIVALQEEFGIDFGDQRLPDTIQEVVELIARSRRP